MLKSKLTTAVLLGLLAAQPVMGQTAQFDSDRLRAMCLQLSCIRAVKVTVGQLLLAKLQPDDFNSQLGTMAALLFQLTNGADQELTAQLAEAMRLLALYSTDTAQQESFIWVAGQISDGAADLFDLNAPFAVSPL